MTTLPHYISAPHPGTGHLETQAVDIYVLATRVVHRAETLLAASEGLPDAVAHIELAFDLALSVTAESTWADVAAARKHLDAAQDQLELSAYWLH
jgi:hypothetical protein